MTAFSANLGFLWNDRPLADAIRAARAAGFDAVECHWPYDQDPLKPFGSGDAFLGTSMATLAAGPGIMAAVTRGAAAAAIAVSRRGCARAMPTGAEIDAFMDATPMETGARETD